ncbi:hypothetical protein ACP275_01G018200 [Erythranthe tilingii]
MKPRTSEVPRGSRNFQEGSSNWILIAGGALLSALSIRLGYKLKQAVDTKQSVNSNRSLKGSKNMAEIKEQHNGKMTTEPSIARPLVTEFNKEHTSSSDSPCVSESGSDIFGKPEVIQKLRQQLKRRDDMILEMQYQIAELRNSISFQLSHSSHLQSLLDSANRDLFDSETEIQRLRKAIADHCVGYEKSSSAPVWLGEVKGNSESSDKKRDEEKIEMLKREVNELKELIEGKDYLLKIYKEQKFELSMKINELQQRLDSQLLNIL